jgi:pyruvate dehydrogenase E2 component (dihydrolipoamide acetyltransferase)
VSVEVTMPRLSDSMEEGTVTKWLIEVGGEVKKGQPLVEIDTDKATMEYEAEMSGTLLEVLVAEGETAPIGAAMARIGEPGEEPAPAKAEVAPSQPVEAAAAAAAPAQAAAPPPPASVGRVNASPLARRLADQLGVDLARVAGSGPGGSITKEDVEQAAGEAGGAEQAQDVEQLSRVQQTIARRMVEGHAAPDFAIEVEVDMSRASALRGELKAKLDPGPSFNDLVLKAVALALREFPRVNGSFTDDGFKLHPSINVGFAVATENALIVPVVRETDSKPLAEITAEARALAEKVRSGKITPAELDGGTFTVSNLGMFGVRRFFPIINPPQAAILGVGEIKRRAVVGDDGAVGAGDVMSLVLVSDHRIVYGADAAQFLSRVRELLEQPDALAD